MKSPEDPPIAPAIAAYEGLANNNKLFQVKGDNTCPTLGKFVGDPSLRRCWERESVTDPGGGSGLRRAPNQLVMGSTGNVYCVDATVLSFLDWPSRRWNAKIECTVRIQFWL